MRKEVKRKKMQNNKTSLFCSSKLTSFEKINENFLKAKCYVMSLGKNRNKSHFSKENVNKAYSSLAYVPVIGHLMKDDNGNYYLGGHDFKIDLSNGFNLKSQCIPFGVAIPSPDPVYECVEEDGNTTEYLVCDVAIWIGRFPELADAFYSNDFYTSQSMEILYGKSEPLKDDTDYTDIIDFSFDALCMLNKSDDPKFNVEPCFPSASIKPIAYGFIKEEFSELMNELKSDLSLYFEQNKVNEGGSNLKEKDEILQKYDKKTEDLDFSIEEMSLEDLELKMEELYGENKETSSFSTTYRQKRDALSNALDPVIITDATGSVISETYFWVEDFCDEYVYVEKDYWTKTDYETKYGRYSYTFDDAKIEASITSDFEEMVKVWLTLDERTKIDEDRAKYEVLSEEYSLYQKEHSFLNSEVEELKTYRKAAEDAIFSEFNERIGGTKEFEELKESSADYSIKDLKKECLCIVGFYATISKPQEIKFQVDRSHEDNDEPYGGLMRKYLNK